MVGGPQPQRRAIRERAVRRLGPGAERRWAVGESSSGNGSDTLIEHWDGSSWTVVPGPNGAKPFTSLTGVTAAGPSDVWAVGSTYDPVRVVFRTFTAHWDGAAWTAVSSPNPSREYDFLQGVTAVPGGEAWAVGAADIATLAMRIQTG